MDVAALQVGDLLHGLGGVFIFGDRAGQGDQNLIGVQARVPAAEVVRLERLDRFDGAGGDQIDLLIDAGQLFRAFSRAEDAAPSSGPVLPVTIVPSASSIAAAG